MVQTHCQHGTNTVSPQGIHSENKVNHEKETLLLSDDPPVPSKSVPRVKGKRKRNSTPLKQKVISCVCKLILLEVANEAAGQVA